MWLKRCKTVGMGSQLALCSWSSCHETVLYRLCDPNQISVRGCLSFCLLFYLVVSQRYPPPPPPE